MLLATQPRNASHILDLLQKEIDQKHTTIRNHATFTTALTDELAKYQETSIRLMEIITKEGDRDLTNQEIERLNKNIFTSEENHPYS